MSDSEYISRRLPACNAESVPYPEATVPPLLGCGSARVDLLTWEDIGKPETLEEWRKALLLPESYTVLKAVSHIMSANIELLIEHKDIPVVTVGALPLVTFRYRRIQQEEGNPRTVFAGMQVSQWDGKRYRTQEITV
jgi:hypothetical protein